MSHVDACIALRASRRVRRQPQLVLLVFLAACAGRQDSRSGVDGAEDIDIPWSNAETAASRASDEQTDSPRSVETSGPDAHRRAGALIDFEVKDTDLHDAFRLLAESAGINLVVADSVQGRISLRVQQVTWREVLETIAKTKHLRLSQQGDIYFIQ